MKTSFFKNIFTLILTMTVLPMVGQDFMNVYFKDGNFQKFYLKDITEISTSKYDSDGRVHSDYNFQQIITLYDTFIYDINDVDSIRFTKFDEENAAHNFVSSLSGLLPLVQNLNTIEDFDENIINKIKDIDGVENAWIDDDVICVKISGWETISFFTNNRASDNTGENNFAQLVENAQIALTRQKTLVKSEGKRLKFALANQLHFNDNIKSDITHFYYPLVSLLRANNIDIDYIEKPTIDFFYDNSYDSNNLHIYDYDFIHLDTHGNYSNLGGESRIKMHSFVTADELGKVSSDDEGGLIDLVKSLWASKKLSNLRKKYKGATDIDINLGMVTESRNGKSYTVFYPSITESFFNNIAKGKFKHNHSVLFNCACHSLEGNINLAKILRDKRNLGYYLGYDYKNTVSPEAGPTLAFYMLNGLSLEMSFENLPIDLKEEDRGNGKFARLLRIPENDQSVDGLFLLPTYTEKKSKENVTEEYIANSNVRVEGMTTSPTQYDQINAGFEYGLSKNNMTNTVSQPDFYTTPNLGKGNIVFFTTLSNLTPDKTYYYRAFTYDGRYYNYGDICSFKIDKLPDLKISTTSMVLALGHTGIIKISGSGDFDAISSDPKTVTVSINNLKDGNADLHIQTHKTGPATITVTDKKTGQTKEIEVTVYPKLQVPTQKLELEEGEKVSFTIAAGSGEYTAKSDKENYATASTKGNEVFIEAVSEGDAVVTITDTKTKLTADVAVKVIKKAAIANITLSTQKLKLNIGETGQIEITSGSGEYGVTNLNSDKAKATLQGTTITIEALAVGDAKIVVTDMKTGQKIIIEVTVTQETAYPDIALSTQEVYLNVGDTEQIEVTSGSGSYSVWVYAPEVANVTVNGRIITIKALSLGSTVVKVTDEVTKKTTTFGIAVIPPSAYDKYAVDLGLSVKWSQINVGAVSVEDWGEHYAWGETESKSYFSWSSYDLCNGTESTITKYNSHDGKTILEPSDDAATVVMGRNWRTPTLTEMQELVNRCKWTQETLNGVKGMRVTGPNGNSIFLPFGGQMSEDVLHHSDTTGYYYVSNLSSDGEKYAPALVCYGNKQEFVPHARFFGLSIRPVFNKK